MNAAKKPRLTRVKKYWKYTSQVEIKLDSLHDWISVLTTFERHLQGIYNNENRPEYEC